MVKLRYIGCVFFLSLMLTSVAFAGQQMDLLRELGEAGQKASKSLLHEPRAIAIIKDRYYIADNDAHRIVVLDPIGKQVLAWGEKGSKPGQFKSPQGIAVDEEGRIYVSDTGNHRIQVFDASGKFLRSFGSKGSGPRQFSGPTGNYVYRGILYVADTGNKRVQVLTADGIFLSQITLKTVPDEMKEPVDVAVDVQNKIYVLDTDNNKVRVFDQTGNQVFVFGTKGQGKEGMDEPHGIAVDQFGNIFLADTGNYKLKKYDAHGKLLGMIGSKGEGRGQFREASGIKVDKGGRVYVLDAEKNTLQIFTCEINGAKQLVPASPLPIVALDKEIKGQVSALAVNKRVWGITGDALRAIGVYSGRTISGRGSDPGQLKGPRGLVADANANFWVADTDNNRLQKFSREGNLMLVVGNSGKNEGELRSPSSIALSSKGNLCVADTGNKRIQIFSANGIFRSAFGKGGKLAGQFAEPVDLAADGSDNLYIVDRGNDRIAKYDENGTLVWEAGKTGSQDGEFNGPENIVISPDGDLYVLDAGNARVQVFSSDGKFLRKFGNEGKEAGEFSEPKGLVVEGGLRLYVGDRGNNRVQVFSFRLSPSIPRELLAQAGANEIQVSWKPNDESYFDHYNLYRSDSLTGEFKLVASTAEPFYLDRGLPSNTSLNYYVASQAKDNGFESAPSTVVFATTPKLMPSTPQKTRIDALEKQITLSWTPNTEPFMSHYHVYRSMQPNTGFVLQKKTDKTILVDRSLADETVYYYRITAVGKEGDESEPTETLFATTPKGALSVPPIEIVKVDAEEIFASAYKYYESHSLGEVTIQNNTDTMFTGLKLTFSIKNFMDYPTEVQIPELAANQQYEVDLKPVFSNKILEVTENTPVQSEIALTYYMGGEAKTVTRSFPVTLYERHAMVWDQKEKLGAFVTPKDPPVADFSRSVIQQYVDTYPNLHPSIVYARSVYDALGVYGMSYIVDPSSPAAETSEKVGAVDYLEYPRDALTRKSGDCDDLSILFASCMENIGIGTAFVDVPGHVFIMFNTGVLLTEKATLGFPEELLVPYDGTLWIPVEMTMVGSSFTRAWQKGAEEYRDWSAKKKMDIIHTATAWELFKPVTLPHVEARSIKVKKSDIEAKFKGELEALARQRLASLSEEYLEALKKRPSDMIALGQLGILYGENGLYAEALVQFQKMLAKEKDNTIALNNIGNIKLLQDSPDEARQAYEAALKLSPEEPGIMVNLARILLQQGKKEEAKKMFHNAVSIDPRMLRQYNDLAASLGISK